MIIVSCKPHKENEWAKETFAIVVRTCVAVLLRKTQPVSRDDPLGPLKYKAPPADEAMLS